MDWGPAGGPGGPCGGGGGGGEGGVCIRVYIGVGGMKVCVTAKLSLSESKREFLCNIFLVSSCEYTTLF